MLQSWGLHVVFWWCPVHGSSQSPQSEQSEHVLSLPRGTRRIVIARIPTQRACVSRASKRASALLFRQYYSRQLSYSPNPIVVGRMAFIADTGLLVGTRRLSRRLSRRLIGVGHFNVCVTEARLLQDSSKSRDNERATPGLCLRSCKQHVVGRQASDMQCVSVFHTAACRSSSRNSGAMGLRWCEQAFVFRTRDHLHAADERKIWTAERSHTITLLFINDAAWLFSLRCQASLPAARQHACSLAGHGQADRAPRNAVRWKASVGAAVDHAVPCLRGRCTCQFLPRTACVYGVGTGIRARVYIRGNHVFLERAFGPSVRPSYELSRDVWRITSRLLRQDISWHLLHVWPAACECAPPCLYSSHMPQQCLKASLGSLEAALNRDSIYAASVPGGSCESV